MSDAHADAALVDAVYATARKYFKSDQVTWEWLGRQIPAFFELTPVEYAAKHGLEALRLHLVRFFESDASQ
jgi:hypothetical protein